MTKEAEILTRALKILKTRGWTKNWWARTKSGDSTNYQSPSAVCFCAVGAVYRAGHEMGLDGTPAAELLHVVAKARGFGGAGDYNDDPRCEFKHVRALFGKAIKIANGEL